MKPPRHWTQPWRWLATLQRRPSRPRLTLDAGGVVLSDDMAAPTRIEAADAAALQQAIAQARLAARRPIEVSIDASQVAFSALGWNVALRGRQRWLALARARLAPLLAADSGDSPENEVRIAPALPPASRLAVGLRPQLLQWLTQPGGRRVASIRISLLDRLNALIDGEPHYSGCVVDAGSDVAWILVLRNGQVLRARRRRLASELDEAAAGAAILPTIIAEWAAVGAEPLPALALCGCRAAAVATVAGGLVPAPRIVAMARQRTAGPFNVDFQHRGSAQLRLGWALLGLGVTVALAAALPLQQALQDKAALTASVERLGASIAAERPSPTAPRPARGSLLAVEQSEASRIAADLNRPWQSLFAGIETADQPEVRVQQISVDARFSQLQLRLEAKSLRDLLAYSQRLATQPPVRSASLVQHEWKDAGGTRVLSARLVAVLEAAAVAPTASVAPGTAVGPVAAVPRSVEAAR